MLALFILRNLISLDRLYFFVSFFSAIRSFLLMFFDRLEISRSRMGEGGGSPRELVAQKLSRRLPPVFVSLVGFSVPLPLVDSCKIVCGTYSTPKRYNPRGDVTVIFPHTCKDPN